MPPETRLDVDDWSIASKEEKNKSLNQQEAFLVDTPTRQSVDKIIISVMHAKHTCVIREGDEYSYFGPVVASVTVGYCTLEHCIPIRLERIGGILTG